MQFPVVPLPEYLATFSEVSSFHEASFYVFFMFFVLAMFMLIVSAKDKDKSEIRFFWGIFFVSLAGVFLGGYMTTMLLLLMGAWGLYRLLIAAKNASCSSG